MPVPPAGGKVFKRNWSRMPLADGRTAERPPLCPRQIVRLRLHQPKLLRLELRQLRDDFLRDMEKTIELIPRFVESVTDDDDFAHKL